MILRRGELRPDPLARLLHGLLGVLVDGALRVGDFPGDLLPRPAELLIDFADVVFNLSDGVLNLGLKLRNRLLDRVFCVLDILVNLGDGFEERRSSVTACVE